MPDREKSPLHRTHHLFLSYSRKDNVAKHAGGEGWITAFERELRRRHQRYSGRELSLFFDIQDIEVGRNWKRELGAGLRSSRQFLTFNRLARATHGNSSLAPATI